MPFIVCGVTKQRRANDAPASPGSVSNTPNAAYCGVVSFSSRNAPSTSVTLINMLTVAPKDQQRLLDVLVEATGAMMNGMPGFVSANLLKSLDGTKVVNYAQRCSTEDFEAMLQDPEAAGHLRKAAKMAENFELHRYEVSFVDEARVQKSAPRLDKHRGAVPL